MFLEEVCIVKLYTECIQYMCHFSNQSYVYISLLSIQVHDEAEFVDKLGCGDVAGVKVLSIFGNTGDGKSHTLNHILFGGESVFLTSKSPSSCTVGVWAAYEPNLSLIALDTEGLLGAASNQNQRMRLLLKVTSSGHLLDLLG